MTMHAGAQYIDLHALESLKPCHIFESTEQVQSPLRPLCVCVPCYRRWINCSTGSTVGKLWYIRHMLGWIRTFYGSGRSSNWPASFKTNSGIEWYRCRRSETSWLWWDRHLQNRSQLSLTIMLDSTRNSCTKRADKAPERRANCMQYASNLGVNGILRYAWPSWSLGSCTVRFRCFVVTMIFSELWECLPNRARLSLELWEYKAYLRPSFAGTGLRSAYSVLYENSALESFEFFEPLLNCFIVIAERPLLIGAYR